MEIRINEHPLDATLDTEKTLGDVLAALESECSAGGAAIIAVAIDGQALPPAEIAAQSPRFINTVATVDITAITADDLAQMLKEMAPRFRS
jgi:hypothetical protein